MATTYYCDGCGGVIDESPLRIFPSGRRHRIIPSAVLHDDPACLQMYARQFTAVREDLPDG